MEKMKVLIAGNKNYGLAKAIAAVYPDATFLSRNKGFNLNDYDTRLNVGKMSLEYDIFISVSCLSQFRQTLVVESVAKEWIQSNHNGYMIVVGSSADTPVKGTGWVYPAEKKALRAYTRQLSQLVSSETPPNWKVTYLSPGNLHTPKQDEKMPNIPKLDTEYVTQVIEWLIAQPKNINISELCLDRIQKD
jgi:NADP-dependent 3-hydroxy acid dehydrogenase YdfG